MACSYPRVADADYSPSTQALSYPDYSDKPYFADTYNDFTFDDMLDSNFVLDGAVPSTETGSSPTSQTISNTTPPATNSHPMNPWSNIDCTRFGPTVIADGAVSNPLFEPLEISYTSNRDSSPTPSLCGDGPHFLQRTSVSPRLETSSPPSPCLSPRSLKRESPSSPSSPAEESASKRPKRGRGRPRLEHHETTSSNSSHTTSSTARHSQVERKYREGLNAELERLRRTVPTLQHGDEGDVPGAPKPSKAMVLSAAIAYIKKLERERDNAVGEVGKLVRFISQ